MPERRIWRSTDGKTFASELLLRVERGEILREPLADPLLVIVLPADRLAPPLMRESGARDRTAGNPSKFTGSLRHAIGVLGST